MVPKKKRRKTPKKLKSRGAEIHRVGVLSDLLSNADHSIDWRKLVAWAEYIGWEHARHLFFIHLAGHKGVRTDVLDNALGFRYDYTILEGYDLIRSELEINREYRLWSMIDKMPPPEGIMIKDSATAEVHRSILAAAEDRAKFLSPLTCVSAREHAEQLTSLQDISKDNINELQKRQTYAALWPSERKPVLKKKRKRRKKKQDTSDPRNVFDEEPRRPSSGGPGYAQTPSVYPRLNEWRMKKNPNHWKPLDWTGYWLFRWKKCYGEEDPLFVGQTLSRSLQSAKKHKGKLDDPYYELGFKIAGLRDNDRGFRGDGTALKEYIDWLLGDFVEEATWLTDPITAGQAFRYRGNRFLERFKVRSVGKSKGGKKKKGKWHHWGYEE